MTTSHLFNLRRFVGLLFPIVLAASILPGVAQAKVVDLRVLVIWTGGNPDLDPGLDLIDDVLDQMGVPYDLFDQEAQTLTPGDLCELAASDRCGERGFYSGIILTNTMQTSLSSSEWETLQGYERDFAVREAVISGFPGSWDAGGYDYGMSGVGGGSSLVGHWQGPAGGTEVFEYLNTDNPLPITDFAFTGDPVVLYPDAPPAGYTGPSVQPLLVAEDEEGNPDPTQTLVSILHYPDGRQVLYSSIANAWFLLHSQVLAYEFVNFATGGVFLGGRHVHLTAHLDDLFLPNALWDPKGKITEPAQTYRLSGQDIADAIEAQSAFRDAHPTVGKDFKVDFPFNAALYPFCEVGKKNSPLFAGEGACKKEDLTDAIRKNKKEFRFINHTLNHADMDGPPDNGASIDPCDYYAPITLDSIKLQITQNREIWKKLGLPERKENDPALVSGNHSGLKNRNCTDEGADPQADDTHYPDGANPDFLLALRDVGVQYIASDSSQPNQNVEEYIPITTTEPASDGQIKPVLMLPRWPTNIFFNTTTPALNEDEYNYIFFDRFKDQGQEPCDIPGAICDRRTYAEILQAEADNAVRHMLSYKPWSHYFHQSNLANYCNLGGYLEGCESGNHSLQFDWLEAAVSQYEQYMKLPIVNLPFYAIGDDTRNRLAARDAISRGILTATWDKDKDEVTLSTTEEVTGIRITGVKGSKKDEYGGQVVTSIDLKANKSKKIKVDQALAD